MGRRFYFVRSFNACFFGVFPKRRLVHPGLCALVFGLALVMCLPAFGTGPLGPSEPDAPPPRTVDVPRAKEEGGTAPGDSPSSEEGSAEESAERTPSPEQSPASRPSPVEGPVPSPSAEDDEAAASSTRGDAEAADKGASRGDALFPLRDGPRYRATLEGKPIVSVTIQGNLKTEPDAILNVIRSVEGTTWSISRIRRDIKAIYALGFFRDIQLDVVPRGDGLALTFIVVEKPSIRSVILDGYKKVGKDDIQEILTVRLYTILNEAQVREDVVNIKNLYADQGYYLAEVTPEIVAVNENQVDVVFHIEENDKVLVRRIYFVGAEKVNPKEFRRFLETKEAGFLSFMTSSGTFNQSLMETDAEIIAAYYNEKGYIRATVEAPRAFITPDRKGIEVTFKIHEGERYKLGAIRVAGDLVEDEQTLLSLLKANEGDYFATSVLREDVQALTDFYSDRGYAFADIQALPDIHDDTKTVDMTYQIRKQGRYYLDRFRITGNTVTWDKTIRREVPIFEGQLYQGSSFKEARRRLERLGYFEEVRISTPRAADDSSLNLDVEVSEKPTGTFNIGAGFSSFENFIFNANISKQNFLGLGYVIGASAQLSALRQQYNLSFFDPYLADTRWTLRVDGYNIEQNYQFSEYRRGLSVGLGHYVSRNDDARFSLKYTLENVGLRYLDPALERLYNGELTRGGTLSSLEGTLTIDRRNNRITPTSGFLLSFSSELAGGYRINENEVLSFFGGDFNFHRHQFNFRTYVPLYKKIEDLAVFRINTSLGAISGLDGRIIPIIHRYRAGGINSVRGYDQLSLGPALRVAVNDEPSRKDTRWVIGGHQILTANIEIEFAILRSAGIRGVIFYDLGNAFDLFNVDPLALTDTYPRMSTGAGIRWFSPMGPLRFEWGFPLTPREGDRRQVFEFTIGSFF